MHNDPEGDLGPFKQLEVHLQRLFFLCRMVQVQVRVVFLVRAAIIPSNCEFAWTRRGQVC